MRKIGRDFAIFAAMPIILAMICVIGLNGDLTQVEVLVPIYLLTLIVALVFVGAYVINTVFRAVRWIGTRVR